MSCMYCTLCLIHIRISPDICIIASREGQHLLAEVGNAPAMAARVALETSTRRAAAIVNAFIHTLPRALTRGAAK